MGNAAAIEGAERAASASEPNQRLFEPRHSLPTEAHHQTESAQPPPISKRHSFIISAKFKRKRMVRKRSSIIPSPDDTGTNSSVRSNSSLSGDKTSIDSVLLGTHTISGERRTTPDPHTPEDILTESPRVPIQNASSPGSLRGLKGTPEQQNSFELEPKQSLIMTQLRCKMADFEQKPDGTILEDLTVE